MALRSRDIHRQESIIHGPVNSQGAMSSFDFTTDVLQSHLDGRFRANHPALIRGGRAWGHRGRRKAKLGLRAIYSEEVVGGRGALVKERPAGGAGDGYSTH